MSFIDTSYFVANLNIPNTDETAVAQKVNLYILKYEPEFLEWLLGYPLYKAFVTGMNVTPPTLPAQRFIDILYGKEYTNQLGKLVKWKGLIITDSPTYNLSGNLVFKKQQYLQAGVTPGFASGVNTATFADWIGWTPIITRTNKPMKPDVDYSYDITTGQITLLMSGDKFGNLEEFFVQFELRTNYSPIPGITPNQSAIANYIYYWLMRNGTTQTTGIGEVRTKAENSDNVSPRQKMISAWNEMHRWVNDFLCFMESMYNTDPTVYPEWTPEYKFPTSKHFQFINPIF